jgi:hypothetical protein
MLIMLFLITGNAKTVYLSFGYEDFVAGTEDPSAREKDISRIRFFGLASDCKTHRAIWLNPRKTPATHYSQGNMDAGNLVFLFGSGEQFKKTSFAFVDQNGILSGLQICFRKDHPDQWLIGLIKNTNLLPTQRQVFIMTSFKPTVLSQSTCNLTEVTSTNNPLIQALASPMLAKFIGQILLANGTTLHPASNVIELFLQFALPQTEFLANDELLQAFNEKMPAILTNEVLKLLQQHRLFPSPQQVLRCLDSESELYRLLYAFEPGEKEQENYFQLAMLLKLDELGLNKYQQDIRSDKEFVAQLSGFLNDINNRFLYACLTDKENIRGLRFIMQSGRFREIFFQLQEMANTHFGRMLAKFVGKSLDYFQIAAICRVIINRPEFSLGQLKFFLNSLNEFPSLKKVDPLELVDFLLADSEGFAERLRRVGNGHRFILAKWENAALVRNQHLSPQILATLGKYCLQGRNPFLNLLDACDDPEQIDAGCTLLELGFTKEEVSRYIQNSSLVSNINWLKINDLLPKIIDLPAISTLIESLNTLNKQRAGLILFTQGQLNATEVPGLNAIFAQFPYLADLIVNMHGEGILGNRLKQFAFNPPQHQVANLLSMHNLHFSLEQLTAVACQFILALADLLNQNQSQEVKVNVNNYLRSVLPWILQYIKQGGHLTAACWQDIDSQRLLFAENGTKDSASFVTQVRDLLVKQLSILTIARGVGVAENQQLMKTRLIAEELARGIFFFAERCESNQNTANLIPMSEQKVLYKQLFAGFAALDENCQLTEKTTIKAVKTLIECHLKVPEAARLVPVDLLLKKPLWADVLRQLARIGFPHIDDIIRFISQNEERGMQFCRAVLKVERECNGIRKRLKAEAKEKYNSFIRPEKEYRRSMYQAIYEEFNPIASVDQGQQKTLEEKIKAAETHITKVVEIDRHPWLRRAMMVIYNLVTIIFTAGHLNREHQRKTGDWYFFARPASSEAVRRLDLEILDEITTAAANPRLGP